MKREDLKAFNLSDEDVQKIMDLHGADIEKQKRSIETLTAERDDFKAVLKRPTASWRGTTPNGKRRLSRPRRKPTRRLIKSGAAIC